jgi:hypothetical protein
VGEVRIAALITGCAGDLGDSPRGGIGPQIRGRAMRHQCVDVVRPLERRAERLTTSANHVTQGRCRLGTSATRRGIRRDQAR